MSDFALSLFAVIIKAFVEAIAKALANRAVSRTKEGTAPICSRDGSDS